MTDRQHAVTAALVLLFICSLVAVECEAAPKEFVEDCKELTASGHRLTGTPEYLKAAEYVETRLRASGADNVIVQEFATAQTEVLKCEIILDGAAKPLQIYSMRPNGVVPPSSPPEGITGPIVYVGNGDSASLSDKTIDGSIVVMDFNSAGWLRLFRLGAKAIVFVKNGESESWHAHHTICDANFPRYYYQGKKEDLSDGQTATIHSEVTWTRVPGRNVFAFFKGTDPVFAQDQDEVVILAAHLDSFGEVPRLSPGARGAANCAGLLKMASVLKESRPKRHVLLAFVDSQARGHGGSAAFYNALEDKESESTLDRRKGYLAAEKEFMAKLESLLSSDQPLQRGASEVRREFLNRLKQKAKEYSFTIGGVIQELRAQKSVLLGENRDIVEKKTTLSKEDAETRLKKIEEELTDLAGVISGFVGEKERWNDLRRVLGQDRSSTEEIKAIVEKKYPEEKEEPGAVEEHVQEIEDYLGIVMDDVRKDVAIRTVELGAESRGMAADTELKGLLGNAWIVFHASLLIGDTTSRWAVMIGSDSSFKSTKDNPGLYGKVQAAFLKAYQDMDAGKPSRFEVMSVDGTLSQTRVMWASPFLVHSGEVAGLFGIYNFAFATCQEFLPREGTPDDTLDLLDMVSVEQQIDEVAALTIEVANLDALSLKRGIVVEKEYVMSAFKNGRATRPFVMGMLPGSSTPDIPMPGIVIKLSRSAIETMAFDPIKPVAFDNFRVLRTNQNGTYSFGPISGKSQFRGFAVGFDSRGIVVSAVDSMSHQRVGERLNIYPCRSGAVVMPQGYNFQKLAVNPVKILKSQSNVQLEGAKSFIAENDGVVHWYCEKKVRGIKVFGIESMVGLVKGPLSITEKAVDREDDERQGVGFSLEETWSFVRSSERSAVDLWRLNESRISKLRAKDIMDSSLGELHGRAEDLLIEAKNDSSPVRRGALAASAFLSEQPVYRKTRGMLDDLVFAVLILLALCVPFAFAMERVIVGSTIIYKQVAWFGILFGLTFLLLYFSHPAFAVSNAPIIIFLGFAIVTLSGTVIFIIMQKFEVELKALQGMTSTVHTADVSRVSTVMAAVAMGISTMRRRPLRTALTAVTIVLLTFTILCFASFGTQTGIVKVFTETNPSYSGVFVHHVNWNPLPVSMLEIIKERWGGETAVCSRWWFSPETEDKSGFLLTREDGSSPIVMRGMLGMDELELEHRKDLARHVTGSLKDSIFITQSVADALKVKKGDTVVVKGASLKIGGLLNAAQLSIGKDMDGNSILPVDFAAMDSQGGVTQSGGGDDPESMLTERQWASLAPDSIVIVSAETAMKVGARLYGVTLYSDDVTQAGIIGENMARMMELPIAATRTDGVYRHILGSVLEASGAADLVFPILLGGLVIFGTMLGSVADREREIYTFSALGLAPQHVASLFFAEAMVYSVIGGMGGYLIAQGVVKLMAVASGYGLVKVPEMNMSSTNAIVTILLVMGTVLVSAIYPAFKASTSANPGLSRSWRAPNVTGDKLDLVFPFTVSQYDITGIVSFLKEHFDNHSDTGLGRFMAQDARIIREEDSTLGLKARLALAPFDLGVSQDFTLKSVESEIPGIDEIMISLLRCSGQPKDWQRLSKVFLDDLRQQFLIWRSLPKETMELYRSRTLATLGEGVDEAEPNA